MSRNKIKEKNISERIFKYVARNFPELKRIVSYIDSEITVHHKQVKDNSNFTPHAESLLH